jgi:hypothetical protein
MDPVFSIAKQEGEIEYARSLTLFILFKPKRAKPYTCVVPLYAETDEGEVLVSTVLLSGIGSSRSYRTSTNSLCLPSVPLGVKSEKEIMLVNVAYIEATITVQLPVVDKTIPLEISFPQGNKLDPTLAQIPIVVSLVSSHPISLSTVVALIDNTGGSYSFTVYATTDNSVFTLSRFLSLNQYKITPPGAKITTVGDPRRLLGDFLGDFLSLPDYVHGGALDAHAPELRNNFLVKFLNCVVLSTRISTFPDDFTTSNGSLLFELINNIAGTKQNVKPAKTLMETLTIILHFLVGAGASLGAVRPEFLLPKTDFVTFFRTKIVAQLLGLDYYNAPLPSVFNQEELNEFTSSQAFVHSLTPRLQAVNEIQPQVSAESYAMIILQCIKVFYFAKLAGDDLSKTLGVPEALKLVKSTVPDQLYTELARPGRAAVSSHVYTTSELMLLKWASIHYLSQNPTAKPKIFVSFAEIADPLVFISVLKSHLPAAKIHVVPEVRDTWENIARFLRSLRLSFFPTGAELASGCDVIHALVLFQLFQSLPHYFSTMNLEFNTELNKACSQHITVSNPSRSEIVYTAVMEGSKSFRCVVPAVRLAPSQTVDFQVTFSANTHVPQTGSLTLEPERGEGPATSDTRPQTPRSDDGSQTPSQSPRGGGKMPVFACPIVVQLASKVTCTAPSQSFAVEGPLYEPSCGVIDIRCPFEVPGMFQVYSKYLLVADGLGNPTLPKITPDKQIMDLIELPGAQPDYEIISPFQRLIKQHRPFLFQAAQVQLPDTKELPFEFNPIDLGTYRCMILFKNAEIGEFVYEIVGKGLVPAEIEVTSPIIKVEARKKVTVRIQIDPVNPPLLKALAYSTEKLLALKIPSNERKLKELVGYRLREYTNIFNQHFTSSKYAVTVSSGHFFQAAPEAVTYKNSSVEGFSREIANVISVTFSPPKPGNYPNKIVLIASGDVRVYTVVGIALNLTKDLMVNFDTIAGREVVQEVPFPNPSDRSWAFKTLINGFAGFTAPPRLVVPANMTQSLRVSFTTKIAGEHKAELIVTNLTKECLTVCHLTATVAEPSAEERVVVKCKAREKHAHALSLPPFVREGKVKVTSNIGVITFPPVIQFLNGKPKTPFEFTVLSVKSGVAAGDITFTDVQSNFYCWYVVEIQIDVPAPEATIEVVTEARKTVTVEIPMTNNGDNEVTFDVEFSDREFFGQKRMVVAAHSTQNYQLLFSPLREGKRLSSMAFYNDVEGEFLYLLSLSVQVPEPIMLKPLQCPIGKSASATVFLENPTKDTVTFRVDNPNVLTFQVVAKPIIELAAGGKKAIDILYIPSSIGVHEESLISFRSAELGNFQFALAGVGKPPQVLSPIIVESTMETAISSTIDFVHPFPYPMTYTISLHSEHAGVFKFLQRKRSFTLNHDSEPHQIPFSFCPPSVGQFRGSIVIAEKKDIQWLYPIIGNGTTSRGVVVQALTGVSRELIERQMQLPLVGERESFTGSEYRIKLEFPHGYEFVGESLSISPNDVQKIGATQTLISDVRFLSKRPLDIRIECIVENRMSQTWSFRVHVSIAEAPPVEVIELECSLNQVATYRVKIRDVFASRTLCHAYFAPGSAIEFSVSQRESWIETSLADVCEMPFVVRYAPKVYGKVMRGLLVLDTLEAQWTFEFVGKVPPYIPPTIRTGLVDFSMPESLRKSEVKTPRKAIIRDNIERAKMPRRPKTTIQPHRNIIRPVSAKSARTTELANPNPSETVETTEVSAPAGNAG